jgi:hypothetical protein
MQVVYVGAVTDIERGGAGVTVNVTVFVHPGLLPVREYTPAGTATELDITGAVKLELAHV